MLLLALLASTPALVLLAVVGTRHPFVLNDTDWVLFAAALALDGVLVLAATERFVAEPIRRLARDVEKWPDAEDADIIPQPHGPVEIVALSARFASTVGSLNARERDLKRSIANQELLMQEIHHRVKNNLQVVASLLNLQASRLRQPETRAAFQSARDRVRALATVHRHLYAEGGLHTISMQPFLTELCEQLFQAFGEPDGDRIRLTIEAPELQMSSDQAVPLSLIVTEAVSNAIKYAFPGLRHGVIDVRLTAEGEAARLTIQDNGVGIPAEGGASESGPRDGLGLQLIRGFARQLGATLAVDDRNGGGTRYTVDMVLRRERELVPAGTPEAPRARESVS